MNTTNATNIDGIEILRRVRPRQHPPLGMGCNGDGQPQPLNGVTPVGWWDGKAQVTGVPNWTPGSAQIQLAVTGHRLLGIVTVLGREDEIWLSLPRSSVSVRAIGEQGFLRKRPREIEISGAGWSITMSSVSRYFANLDAFQDNQERSLLQALQAPAPSEPERQPKARAEITGSWRPNKVGIFLQSLPDRPASGACVVDPTAPADQQLTQLATATWVPTNIAELLRDSVRRATVEPGTEPLVAGLSHSPITVYPQGAIMGPSEDTDPTLRSYLWPALDGDLLPRLEPGETTLLRWQSKRSVAAPYMPEHVGDALDWLITTNRLIVSCRGLSRTQAAAMHMRWEWMTGLRTRRFVHYDERQRSEDTLYVYVITGAKGRDERSIGLNDSSQGLALAEQILTALRQAAAGRGLAFAPPQDDVSEHPNAKTKGTLTVSVSRTNAPGYSVPSALLDW